MSTSMVGMLVLAFVACMVGCNEQPKLNQRSTEGDRPPAEDELEVMDPVMGGPPVENAEPAPEKAESTKDATPLEADSKEASTEAAQPTSGTVEQVRTFTQSRERMVNDQMARRGIVDRRVLSVMRRVPRHEFVPDDLRHLAYSDQPLPIGHGQTISQPYIVALMTQLAKPKADARVLDIGTGSGYQAAVLAELVEKVHSIEIVRPLADSARERLKTLGYDNVEVICGDGYQGLPREAPFDLIIVAAAPDHVPEPLIHQLVAGGRLVIPVGRSSQELLVIEKLSDGKVRKEYVTAVSFVPMTGEAVEHKD